MARNQVSRVRPISDLIKHTNHASAGVHRREKRLDPRAYTRPTRFLFSWSFANATRTSWLDSPPPTLLTPPLTPRDLYRSTSVCVRAYMYISPTSKDRTFALAAFSNAAAPCHALDLCLPFQWQRRKTNDAKENLKMRTFTTNGAYLFSNYDQIVCENCQFLRCAPRLSTIYDIFASRIEKKNGGKSSR